MDDDKIINNNDTPQADDELTTDTHSDYKPADRFDASAVHHLSGMYKNWFLTTPRMLSWSVPCHTVATD